MISKFSPLVNAQGLPTTRMLEEHNQINRRLSQIESKLAAIAAIAAPTGGAITDAEARAAINEILSSV